MGSITVPFSEEMRGTILREARRKQIEPEVLLKVWILERARRELGSGSTDEPGASEAPRIDLEDLLSMPLRFGLALLASATATVSTLVDEISR